MVMKDTYLLVLTDNFKVLLFTKGRDCVVQGPVSLLQPADEAGQGEAEPLVEGDGPVTVLVNLLEQSLRLLPLHRGDLQPEPGGGGGEGVQQ